MLTLSQRFYYLFAFLIVAFSSYYYLPCLYTGLNSDHAIHVLMAYDFELPRDYYYMGQNRLGSLLPMVAHFLIRSLKIHPLYACSIAQFFFLFIPFLIIEKWIIDRWLKLSLLLLIFLPVNTYDSLVLIGHPYSQQFFCGTLALYFFVKLHEIIIQDKTVWRDISRIVLYGFLFAFFFTLGIWVSEFNAVIILIPFLYLLKYYKVYFSRATFVRTTLFVGYEIILLARGLKFYLYTKEKAFNDGGYTSFFITDQEKIFRQLLNMKTKMTSIFNYKDLANYFDNTIYYLLILLSVYFILNRKKMNMGSPALFVAFSLIIISIISFIIMFFSAWNLRSEYGVRYYIPVYLMIAVAFCFYFDSIKTNVMVKPVFFILILLHCFAHTWYTAMQRNEETAMNKYSDFSTLPKGTLIAGYWECYIIASVSIENLFPLTYDNDFCRNCGEREKLLAEKNIYFLNDENFRDNHFPDTIRQYGHPFVSTGVSYNLKTFQVLQYRSASR